MRRTLKTAFNDPIRVSVLILLADAEDSFPTGSIRKTGRIFCRPDLVNVQKLDGILYNVKYLVIARNVTVRGRIFSCIRF